MRHVVNPGTVRRVRCMACRRMLCWRCSAIWTDDGPPLYECAESPWETRSECKRIELELTAKDAANV